MILRPYQQRTVSDLFAWWAKHNSESDIPILSLPTAAGKSIICAEIVRQMYAQWPEYEPRTIVIVPSKELAEQNAEKLRKLLPDQITVGFVSASLNERRFDADVIVATIGSIAKHAHMVGNIKCVIIDECHLVNPKGDQAGMYRSFLSGLSVLCDYRTVGMTATPFRGNGVWLTDGESPLFTGIASRVTMRELLDHGYISELVPPAQAVGTKIDASSVGIVNGDYKVSELAQVVDTYLFDVARESVELAVGRRKWIAFTPSVANAETLCASLSALGTSCAVVCGETPADERASLIADFKAGRIRCLVTVLALTTGFDVPDVDCIIWCRPTKSPVLYVQGMGRGVRIAAGKVDCLVLDFTDTVERLGPVDTIQGRAKSKARQDAKAPFVICDSCGSRNHAAALVCIDCGAVIREETQAKEEAKVSLAAVMSSQKPSVSEVEWVPVTNVEYRLHSKPGKPDSLRVDYYSGYLRTASEWVCFDHTGYARQKAVNWYMSRCAKTHPGDTQSVLHEIESGFVEPREPIEIAVRRNGKFMEVVSHKFNTAVQGEVA